MIGVRKSLLKKMKEVELLSNYMKKYKVIGLVSMEKIDGRSITKLRKQLRGKVVIRMAKKNLMIRAMKKTEEEDPSRKNLTQLGKEIKGISALIFTDMNPIKLARFLKENSTKAPAKPGDIAPEDIIVPAGDTRIPPGPIISELNTILKLPTMIKNGTIHIRQDTLTHKKGDVIDYKAALLLSRLGIEPMTIMLDFYAAWENGEIIPEAVLKLDENKIIEDVKNAYADAFTLAMALEVLSEETLEPLIGRAYTGAKALALELPIIIEDLIPDYITKASAQASALYNTVFGGESEEGETEEQEEEKKEEQEEKDDDSALGEGLMSLFG